MRYIKRLLKINLIAILLLSGCANKSENEKLVYELVGGIYEPNGIVYEVYYGEETVNRKDDFYNATVSLFEAKDYDGILKYITENDISVSTNLLEPVKYGQ